MITHIARWSLAALLCLALLSACDSQDAESAATDTETNATSWEEHMRAGITAYRQGRYAEAERQWDAGLEQAERFGREDPRLGTNLNNLAALYQVQGKYTEAELHYKRVLRIDEKALGPEHRDVATSLENYAALLRETGRGEKAEEMEARAKTIRAKY
jgi:tetratricopeptide (TPR) repeat protein